MNEARRPLLAIWGEQELLDRVQPWHCVVSHSATNGRQFRTRWTGEVRFLGDEMANMVWSIEETVENGIGLPLPGLERYHATRPVNPTPPAPPSTQPHPPLKYEIQTEVPENWIPFRSLIDEVNGDIALQIAAMLRTRPRQPPEPILPLAEY